MSHTWLEHMKQQECMRSPWGSTSSQRDSQD